MLGRALLLAAVFAGLLGATARPVAAAAIAYTVNTAADTTSAGACAAGTPGQCSLREAVAEANAVPAGNRVSIGVPAGTYTLPRGTLALAPAAALPISGAAAAGATTIVGGDAGQVMSVAAGGPVDLADLTVSGGNGSVDDGGGIGSAGTLTLDRVTVTANRTGYGHNGGGIYNDNQGTLTLNSSTVSGNAVAGNGAGGGIFSNGTVVLNGSTVSGNNGGTNSGGIYSFRSLALIGSAVSNNTAGEAGGIFDFSGVLTIDRSTVAGNTATDPSRGSGGGIEASVGRVTITASTINGNTAAVSGGGIAFYAPSGFGGSLAITNSTISGNSAPSGGGVHLVGPDGSGLLNSVTIAANSSGLANAGMNVGLRATIVAGSTAGPDCVGPIPDRGDNLDGGTSCRFTQPTSLSGRDPRLGPLADNGGPTRTMALLPGSPAIDAGGSAADGCPATDQRGVARPQGPACDIGAYEAAGAPPTVSGISPAGGPAGGGTSVTISGSGLAGATAVHFGPSMARSFAAHADGSLTAVAPAGPAGAAPDVTVSTSLGTSAAVAADRFTYTQPANPPGGPYHPLPPQRLLDTRGSGQTLGAVGTLGLPVAGHDQMPASGATAALLNVTVTNTTAPSFLTVSPDGVSRPLASSLNWAAGQTVPNLVVVQLGADGSLELFNAAGSANLVADVVGYFQ